jgi:hypothetical protein
MRLWARVREIAAGRSYRLLGDLTTAYFEELRLAGQLRAHAERVPYPDLATVLLGLANGQDQHAALVRERVARLGGALDTSQVGAPHEGPNYWARLTHDLADLRAQGLSYLELAHRWDTEDEESAALCATLAHEESAACRVIGDMIARSDPHAAD